MAKRRAGVTLLIAVAVLTGAGCSNEIPGTPVAAPGQAGKGAMPADLLATTCREYLDMDDATRRAVMKAIANDGNQIVEMNPELWTGVATAMCGFVDPSAPVRDIVVGQGIR